jgi:hypothetical protein
MRYLIILSLFLSSTFCIAQDHARGVSKPGPLGNGTAAALLPPDTPMMDIEIVKVSGKQAFIDAGQSRGIQIGQTFKVGRRMKDRWLEVGEVRVLAVLKNESVVELVISKVKTSELQVGDRLVKK